MFFYLSIHARPLFISLGIVLSPSVIFDEGCSLRYFSLRNALCLRAVLLFLVLIISATTLFSAILNLHFSSLRYVIS